MNELANVTITSPSAFNFKNKKLNEVSAKIAKAGADMSSKNREIAKLLGMVKKDKLYTDDGFKSVDEFAEKTFGIKKALAYQLANVGERFYNVDSETAKKVSAMLPPSNLAEIAGMKDEDIQKAIDAGEIKEGTTQQKLRDIAKTAKVSAPSKTGKQKVLPTYEADVTILRVDGADRMHFDKSALPDIQAAIDEKVKPEGTMTKTFVREGKYDKEYHRGIVVTLAKDAVVVLTYGLATTPPKSKEKPATKDYTIDELEAMLAAKKAEAAKEAEG